MSTVRPRKNYDRMEDKPLVTADEYDEDDPQFKSKTDQWLQYILHKLHALLWIVIATGIAIHTELFELIVDGHPPSRPAAELNRCAFFSAALFFAVLRTADRHTASLSHVCSFWFNVGLAGFGGWLLMAAYLILWVKYIKKYNGEWEDYWPQAIPIATFMAVSSLIAFVVAFWPVWGWLTIPGIFVLFLGVLNLAHFVPV